MGWYEAIKDVVSLVQKSNDLELLKKVMELQTAGTGLSEENVQLKREVHRLEEALSITGDLQYDKSSYWLRKGDEKGEGPYCSRCWEVDHRLIRMLPHRAGRGSECPQCKTSIRWTFE